MTELPWIEIARGYIGIREDKSSKTNPVIEKWLHKMPSFKGASRAWWNDDETPWCGLFTGYCLGVTGRHVVKEWYRAKSWESAKEMTKLSDPAYGCIVTFTRDGGGHVGFVVGNNQSGKLMVLGGNQGDAVSIAPFELSRVTGYYWPSFADGRKSIPSSFRYDLPLINSTAKVSTNEA